MARTEGQDQRRAQGPARPVGGAEVRGGRPVEKAPKKKREPGFSELADRAYKAAKDDFLGNGENSAREAFLKMFPSDKYRESVQYHVVDGDKVYVVQRFTNERNQTGYVVRSAGQSREVLAFAYPAADGRNTEVRVKPVAPAKKPENLKDQPTEVQLKPRVNAAAREVLVAVANGVEKEKTLPQIAARQAQENAAFQAKQEKEAAVKRAHAARGKAQAAAQAAAGKPATSPEAQRAATLAKKAEKLEAAVATAGQPKAEKGGKKRRATQAVAVKTVRQQGKIATLQSLDASQRLGVKLPTALKPRAKEDRLDTMRSQRKAEARAEANRNEARAKAEARETAVGGAEQAMAQARRTIHYVEARMRASAKERPEAWRNSDTVVLYGLQDKSMQVYAHRATKVEQTKKGPKQVVKVELRRMIVVPADKVKEGKPTGRFAELYGDSNWGQGKPVQGGMVQFDQRVQPDQYRGLMYRVDDRDGERTDVRRARMGNASALLAELLTLEDVATKICPEKPRAEKKKGKKKKRVAKAAGQPGADARPAQAGRQPNPTQRRTAPGGR